MKLQIDRFARMIKRDFQSLYGTFIDPKLTGEDDRRKEFILNIILVGSIIALILLDAVVLRYKISQGSEDRGVPFLDFTMIPVFFAILLALSRRGFATVASYLLIAAYFLTDSYAIWRWTADLPSALLGYALIILIASILIDTRFGFITTGAIGAFLVPMGYLQTHAIIASDASWKQNANDTDALVFAILLLLIMTIAWLSNREIEKSLSRARASEQALQHERDSLEVKVEERTYELQKAQFERIEQINQFAKFGQLASGLFHDMLNIMNTLSIKIDLNAGASDRNNNAEGWASESASATTKQIEQFMSAIRKQLNRQETQESFSLIESIDQSIRLLSHKANQEGVRVILMRENTDDLFYWGNPFKFHQIMFNLILNGIESYESPREANNREKSVRVYAKEKNGKIIIKIKDQGRGIDKAVGERIFDAFFSTKPEPKGMGIGLASVKKIVEEDFAGTITVQSEPGEGSTFIVVFPLRTGAENLNTIA